MKKQRIVLSDAAVADILDQADWYQNRSDYKLASRWENSVTSTLLRILRNPRAGALCTFKSEELRDVHRTLVTGFSKHLVFYQSHEEHLLILRVVHGARDLESLF